MTHRRLLCPLALLVVLAGAAPAGAAVPMEVAVEDDAAFVGSNPATVLNALNRARQLNATRIRVEVEWASVPGALPTRRTRPRTVTYDWSQYDTLIDAAAARGMTVQMTLDGPAPAWATSTKRQGVTGISPTRFAAFARAAAQHFRNRVKRYSIYNEPTFWAFLQPPQRQSCTGRGGARRCTIRAATIYRQIYAASYNAIKRVSPTAQVLIGETSPYAVANRTTAPLAFLRAVLCVNASYTARRCPGLRADGYAHHPYNFRSAPNVPYPGADNVTIGSLGNLRSALSKLARNGALRTPTGGTPPIYLTEFGYPARGPFTRPPATRARYLRQAFQIALTTPSVRQLLQYQLYSPPANVFFNTSVLTTRGAPTSVFNSLAAWTRSAAARRQILVPPARVRLPAAPPPVATPT